MKVLYSGGILKAVVVPRDHDGFFLDDLEKKLNEIVTPINPIADVHEAATLKRISKGAWHITLIHQSILRPYRKELKGMEFPQPPRLPCISECTFGIRESGEGGDYRKSFVLWFPDSYQKELKAYVLNIMRRLKADEEEEYYNQRPHHLEALFWDGMLTSKEWERKAHGRSFFQSCIADPEPERRFHISLANLTGKPGGSVR
jgi:hypothetical protein